MGWKFKVGDCVRTPDGRFGRVRGRLNAQVRVRVRRHSGGSHQFVLHSAAELVLIDCPKGWMSPEGYRRYLRVTLAKMRLRQLLRSRR